MIKVFLCDDEPTWVNRLSNAISTYKLASSLEFEIVCETTSPEAFLKCFNEDIPTGGLYFLDIDFKDVISGFDLAKHILEADPQAKLVFVTTHDELAVETYRLRLSVFDFVVKDGTSLNDQIGNTLRHVEHLYHAQKEGDSPLLIHMGDTYHAIFPSEIYYIETIKEAHKICIHLKSELFRVSGSIASISKRLGDNFFSCHKTCLVNVRHIKQLIPQKGEILLDNGDVCCCSVRGSRSLLKRYQGIEVDT